MRADALSAPLNPIVSLLTRHRGPPLDEEELRSQWNDAVHPEVGQVEKNKVFITIQSFPAALELVYRLMCWFQLR